MRNRNKPEKLTASVARAVAVRGMVDPRTLRRYVDGQAVSPMCATRIEQALRDSGLEQYIHRNAAN